MMSCSTTVNNLLWNLHSVIFCFTTFNQLWLLVVEQFWHVYWILYCKKQLVSTGEIFTPFCY